MEVIHSTENTPGTQVQELKIFSRSLMIVWKEDSWIEITTPPMVTWIKYRSRLPLLSLKTAICTLNVLVAVMIHHNKDSGVLQG